MVRSEIGTQMLQIPDRWSLLAGMRFFLASLVVMTHLTKYVSAPWAEFLGTGFEAIMGFLIISGYSIAVSY
jgi:peptidoglycan/LPS O-acetylase OafA/YrhL